MSDVSEDCAVLIFENQHSKSFFLGCFNLENLADRTFRNAGNHRQLFILFGLCHSWKFNQNYPPKRREPQTVIHPFLTESFLKIQPNLSSETSGTTDDPISFLDCFILEDVAKTGFRNVGNHWLKIRNHISEDLNLISRVHGGKDIRTVLGFTLYVKVVDPNGIYVIKLWTNP